MAGKAYLTRLKASNSPSHQLLVLLDRHRVMSTTQITRATGAPERTIRYRMEQLEKHGLVGQTRPGLERGSAPRFWWLTNAGARIVTGTALAEGRPKPTTIPHGAAITEVFLAFKEQGPRAGIEVLDWKTDRAGWQEWQASGGLYHGMDRRRLTPDALCRLLVATADGPRELAVFIEVDLASMTQTQMRQKLGHYLAYRDDRAWEEDFASCPPMLLFTSTDSRAINFMKVAAKPLAGQAPPSRWAMMAQHTDIAAASELMAAACGLVYTPADAITDMCWTLPDGHASQVCLAEMLAARTVVADRAAAAWQQVEAEEKREHDAETLARLGSRPPPGFRRGEPGSLRVDDLDPDLRETYESLVPTRSGYGLLDGQPQLAAALLHWEANPGDPAAARAARTLLAAYRRRAWIADAQTVLTAVPLIQAQDLRLLEPVDQLTRWRILRDYHRTTLAGPADREHCLDALQAESLAGYSEYRDQQIAHQWQRMSWLARKRTSREQLAATFDNQNLYACPRCTVVTWNDPDDPHARYGCPGCGTDLDPVPYPERGNIPTLAQRLDALRRQLEDVLADAQRPLPPPGTRA